MQSVDGQLAASSVSALPGKVIAVLAMEEREGEERAPEGVSSSVDTPSRLS